MNHIVYPNKKIYVSGLIGLKFDAIENFIQQNKEAIFILNGGVCLGQNDEEIEQKILKLIDLKKNNLIYYNLSPEDLFYLNKLKKNINFNFVFDWITNQKFVTNVQFSNQTTIFVMSGAITSVNFKNDVSSCLHNDPSWHQSYDGNLGFIISNMPKSPTLEPTLYNFSCSIGVQDASKVILQEIGSQGLMNFFVI
jgi:hypothetical protein